MCHDFESDKFIIIIRYFTNFSCKRCLGTEVKLTVGSPNVIMKLSENSVEE